MGCNVLYGLGSIQFWAFNLLEKTKIQNSVQLPKKIASLRGPYWAHVQNKPKNAIWYMGFVGLFFVL